MNDQMVSKWATQAGAAYLLIFCAWVLSGCMNEGSSDGLMDMEEVPETIIAATEQNAWIEPIMPPRATVPNDPGEGDQCSLEGERYFYMGDHFPDSRPASRELIEPTDPTSPLDTEIFFTFNTLIDPTQMDDRADLQIHLLSFWLGEVNGTTEVTYDEAAQTTTFRFIPNTQLQPGTRYRVEFNYRNLRDRAGRQLCLERLAHPYWDEAYWWPFTTMERPEIDTPAGMPIVRDIQAPKVCMWSSDIRHTPESSIGFSRSRIFYRIRFSEAIDMRSVGGVVGRYENIFFRALNAQAQRYATAPEYKVMCRRPGSSGDELTGSQILLDLHCEVDGLDPLNTLWADGLYQPVVSTDVADLNALPLAQEWTPAEPFRPLYGEYPRSSSDQPEPANCGREQPSQVCEETVPELGESARNCQTI